MRGPGSYLVGILEAVVFHNLRKWKKCHSVMSDSATPWTITYQVPLSMGFSRQEYWSGLPFPSPRDLPDPGIEPGLPHGRQTLYCLSHLVNEESQSS